MTSSSSPSLERGLDTMLLVYSLLPARRPNGPISRAPFCVLFFLPFWQMRMPQGYHADQDQSRHQ
jgi:hypothetical protein